MDEEIAAAIYFVTGNEGKFREAKALLPSLERIDFDLPEEQTLDPQVVITRKLEVARLQKADGALIVEDTSLYLAGLNGFPGPLIKWMLQAVGNQGIYDLASAIKNRSAMAKTVIGYDDGTDVRFFEGEIDGQIVAPAGIDGFGWDEIFKPSGLDETFAEMGDGYKPEFSMRSAAFTKLKAYLETSDSSLV